jgi:hypothetical protein
LNFNIVFGQYNSIYCDICGIEIEKHGVLRLKRKLEGKKNFCCNVCKFKYYKYCAKQRSNEKLLKV